MQCYGPSKRKKPNNLQSRSLPEIAFRLHHRGLFMREAYLAFFVETGFLEVFDYSVR